MLDGPEPFSRLYQQNCTLFFGSGTCMQYIIFIYIYIFTFTNIKIWLVVTAMLVLQGGVLKSCVGINNELSGSNRCPMNEVVRQSRYC